MRTRLRTLRRAAKQTREDSMRQRIVRTRCGCDQRRAVPFGEILQQSERVGTYPEHRDKAFRWTGCWSEGDSNPRCREGLYGRNSARGWRTIRPEKKHPCWREFVRLEFGSVSCSLRFPLYERARQIGVRDQPIYQLIGNVQSTPTIVVKLDGATAEEAATFVPTEPNTAKL